MDQQCSTDTTNISCNLNDAVPQTSTSSHGVEHTYRKNSYVVIRTEAMKMKLRNISKPKYHEIGNLEEEEVFAEESSEYEPSEDERLEITSESDTSIKVNPDFENSPPKKGKKRTRNPENWKKMKAKFLKNPGKSYQSRTGKIVKERVMGPPCSNRCKLSCSTKFDNNFRTELFEDYWKLASLQRQRDFLGSCIEPLHLKYRRISSSKAEARRQNCPFFLLNGGKRIRVCKPFIISTLGVTERTIRTIIQSKATGAGIIKDKRGRHGNQKKTDDEILNSVREHIMSIPRVESQYLRAKTTRAYVDGGLCIAEMHRHYHEMQNNAKKSAANYDTYGRIFNTEFNIGFFVPRKDQCDVCEAYKNATGTMEENLESAYQLHQKEKKLSRDEKARDKENGCKVGSNIVLATYDLQAVLPVPMGQTSAFYYKSRLNCYNLTISEILNDHTVCYFWHEGLGNRGVNEIGSCVILFLEELANTRADSDVVCYTDNCGGQQKNRFMIGIYLYAVEKFNLKSITHKFLIRGHTQNEGDAVHSTIEKSLKKVKKSGPIYVPDQYVSVIRTAKKKGNPFIVKVMSFADFMDLKLLSDQLAFNYSKNKNGDQIRMSDIKMLRFEKGSESYLYKTSYNDVSWQHVQIKPVNRRSARGMDIKNISLKPSYNSKLPISENKKEDIKSLLQSNIIPIYYEPFFNSIM